MKTKKYPAVGQSGNYKTYLNASGELYTTHNNQVQAFKEAMFSVGIGTDEPIIVDGQLHRFTVSGDKPRSLNGWYVLYGDVGVFGCWKLGINQTWCSKSRNQMTKSERHEYLKSIRKAAELRKQELIKRHGEARQNANTIWNKTTEVTRHSYLEIKQCKSFGLRLSGDSLVMPLRDVPGNLHSLQFIKPDGAKRMLSGGKKKGMFHLIGNPEDILLVCEGYSTGATLHECTSYPVAIAVDSGNLKPVGQSLHKHYPDTKLIFCADNDQYSSINVGVNKATEAAQVTAGVVAIPEFKNTSSKPTDFNDLFRLEGRSSIMGTV